MSQKSPTSDTSLQKPVQSPTTSPTAPETSQHVSARAIISEEPAAERPSRESLQVDSARGSRQDRSSNPISPSPARSLGVHSILNPSQNDSQSWVQQARSPQPQHYSQAAAAPPISPFSTAPPSVNIPQQDVRPSEPINIPIPTSSQPAVEAPVRRILTPRSPGNRATTLPNYPGTIPPINPNARYLRGERLAMENTGSRRTSDSMQFPPIRPQTSGQSGVAPRPPPPFGSLPEPSPSVHARRASGGSGLGIAGSQDASPSTSHSSYSQFSQTSPATGFGMMPRPQSSFPQGPQPTLTPYRHISSFPGGPSPTTGPGGPPLDLRGGSYEMTLDTEHGPLRVPVDVQQASHVADEKRKRNAGASARFRARRKEKEREASQTIGSLENELREMTEERDFYVNERNFFKDLAARHVPPTQMPPRPTSPRHRRPTQPPAGASNARQSEDPEEPAAHRRRTNEYQPTTVPAPIMAPIVSRPPYGPPGPVPPAHFQMPHPESRPSGSSVPPPPPPGSLPPRTERYDPFRQDPFHRSWNPGR